MSRRQLIRLVTQQGLFFRIVVAGGLGIILGIATYGYKIMRVVGVKMVHLTFARGFAVELGAAIVIVVASKYGLPVSSTQVRHVHSCPFNLSS